MAKVNLAALVCGLATVWLGSGRAQQPNVYPQVSQRDREIAAETDGRVGDFVDAVLDTAPGTQDECSVAIRVMKAGAMTPIVSGVRLTAATSDEHGHAVPGGTLTVDADRKGVWTIGNAPPRFLVWDYIGAGGAGRGVIERRCWGAVSTLLLLVKDPENLAKGADWVWDTKGKYAVK